MKKILLKDFEQTILIEEIEKGKLKIVEDSLDGKEHEEYNYNIDYDFYVNDLLNSGFKEIKYYTMEHKGGLDEALQTKKEITREEFEKLLPMYEFYAIDKRINCNRYILKDMEKNFRNYTIWLLEEK